MPTADVRGATIAFDDTGGTGPPIVLSHGFLMDRSMFAPQVAALEDRYRVITWDERGHGDTAYDGAEFTYWDSAADCLGLLDHLGIEWAVLGGMSHGGFLSLRAALLAPDRVRALILLDSQAGLEDPTLVPLYRGMIDSWVDDGPTRDLADAAASIIIGDAALSQAWTARWMARPKEALRVPGQTLIDRDDVTGRLPEIAAPALVVHGTADVAIPMERAEMLADGLPGCSGVVEIDGGTHSANLTHPGPVNEAILAFLDGLPG